MATYSSILVWRIPWTEATVPGAAKSQTYLSDQDSVLKICPGSLLTTISATALK